jgi:hypothetical protein
MDEKTLACDEVYHRLRAAAKADFPHQHTQHTQELFESGRRPITIDGRQSGLLLPGH